MHRFNRYRSQHSIRFRLLFRNGRLSSSTSRPQTRCSRSSFPGITPVWYAGFAQSRVYWRCKSGSHSNSTNFSSGKTYISAHSRQMLEATNRHLQDLYRNLMAPLTNFIKTPHIAIVPHRSLHSLPFHAFLNGEKYLIDEYEISYAPSGSVLKYCLEKDDVTAASPLLVGVADERVPLVKEELLRLKNLFPDAQVLQDESATRGAFVDSSKACRFLHVATHVVFGRTTPCFQASSWPMAGSRRSICLP